MIAFICTVANFRPKAINLNISSDPCYGKLFRLPNARPGSVKAIIFSATYPRKKITTLGNNNKHNNQQFKISRLRAAIIRRSFPMTSPSLICVTNRLHFNDLRRLLLNCRKKKQNKCFSFLLATTPKAYWHLRRSWNKQLLVFSLCKWKRKPFAPLRFLISVY